MSDQPNLELLHENRHIPNVTGWSDWLVAQRLPELTAIDCALLLMSAYIHVSTWPFPHNRRAALAAAPKAAGLGTGPYPAKKRPTCVPLRKSGVFSFRETRIAETAAPGDVPLRLPSG